MSLFSNEEAEQIRRTVTLVEKTTAGELAVVVTQRSDDYAFHRSITCLVTTVAGGWLVYQGFPLLPSAWVFGGQAVVWALCWWLSAWPPLLRSIVPRSVREQAVVAKTKQIFIDYGVTETRDRSGVLIFISEAEHQVHILADRGVHERVGDVGWNKYVGGIVDAIRAGRTAAGLCEQLTSIGVVLAENFPPRPDDDNELPDELVRV